MTKFDHTRVRVSDLERSIKFYCDHFGFKVLKRNDKSPSGNQIAHLELPGNDHLFELTYSPDYDLKVPEDLFHICLVVDDIIAFCDRLEKEGLEVWPGDWRETFKDGRKMAFITDPDNYEIELLEK